MAAKHKKSQSRSQASGQAITNLEGGTQTSAEPGQELQKFLVWLAQNTLQDPWHDQFRRVRALFHSGYLIVARRSNLGTKNAQVQLFAKKSDEP